jgi:hypothetical protein
MSNGEKILKACTMANGAVFFIPDEVERKSKPVSYYDLVKQEEPAPAKKMSLFDRLMKRDRLSAHNTKAA